MSSLDQYRTLRQLMARDPEGARAMVRTLSTREQQILRYRWEVWARDDQLLPPGEWRHLMFQCGRGWGKTRTGSEIVRVWRNQGLREIALIGDNAADLRDVMVTGPSGIIATSPPWDRPRWIEGKRSIFWAANRNVGLPPMRALCLSAEDPEQIRGPEVQAAWCDEIAKCRRLEAVLSNLEFATRIDRPGGLPPQIIFTTTPRRTEAYVRLSKTSGMLIVRGATLDNVANLSAAAVKSVYDTYDGTRTGRQELEGELLEDVDGALWTREMIEAHRAARHGRWDGNGEDVRPWYIWDSTVNLYRAVPAFVQVVVGVDPSVAAGGSADTAECGIVVVAKGEDGHLYVLEDATVRGSPATWAAAAVSAYERCFANRMVAETNQGGALVESNIRAQAGGVAYEGVHSKEGKRLRADPVSTWSERGKVHFVGSCPRLEDQMTSWVPGAESPDRLDAFVHACTWLMDPVPMIY